MHVPTEKDRETARQIRHEWHGLMSDDEFRAVAAHCVKPHVQASVAKISRNIAMTSHSTARPTFLSIVKVNVPGTVTANPLDDICAGLNL